MRVRILAGWWLAGWLTLATPAAGVAQTFPDYDPSFGPPTGWTGRTFTLSQDYPAQLPPPETRPWEAIDFRQDALGYLRAVLSYALEGNTDIDFDVARNPVRTWYHTPWLHPGCFGREFVGGLTRERRSRAGELHPAQASGADNWAVGFYNPPGGYAVGRVWKTATGRPDPAAASFPPGTVSFKLLFTTATPAQVPFLANTLEWDANIYPETGANPCPAGQPPAPRSNAAVRLLQIDVAVRDDRAGPTGWIFGTFIYDGSAPGARVWDRLVPVGLTWGNDPGVTVRMRDPGAFANPALMQSIVNEQLLEPNVVGTDRARVRHLGLGGRLNGPVDNPISSCISCHGRAASPDLPLVPNVQGPANYTEDLLGRFFENVPGGAGPVPGDSRIRLDYSLQLATGLENYCRVNACQAPPGPSPSPVAGPASPAPVPTAARAAVPSVNREGGAELATAPGALPGTGSASGAGLGPPLAILGLALLLAGLAMRRANRSRSGPRCE